MTSGEPRRLGRYQLLELLGHGAMGVVYKAHDSFLDRTVAVKTYRQDVPITDQVRKRFEREVRTASKLNHPNIVVVHDGGLEQDVPYLAMEYVDGPTLAAELARRGRLPTAEALTLIEKIADGLAYAHANGVVHRDLKPANILLAGGTPKIADFGVAKLMTAEATATTTPVGTPSYMAPEQIEGKTVDARTDVFALGILAYELLTGRAPFAGEGWTAVMFQIMNVEPEEVSKLDPSLPGAVDEVIARSLAKDPAKRTPDVATFSKELREAFAPPKPVAPPPPPPRPRPEERHAPLDAGAFEVFRDLAPKSKEPSLAGPAIAVVVLLTAVLAMIINYRGSRRAAVVPQGTPIAMATSAPPTMAPVIPTVAPPKPAPTARPVERPTAAPRIEPTAPPRIEPTSPPRVVPTSPPRIEPTAAPPPPTAPPPRPRPTYQAPARDVPTVAPVVAPPPAPAPVAVPPPVESAKPTIDVISDPPGADVAVNGVLKGRTPVRIADLNPGSYDFEVRKEGFNSYRKTTRLDPNSDYQMNVKLPVMVNSLRVLSQPPGVTVKVNGELKGRTPLTLGQLANGHYEVSGEREGFPTQTLGVDLKDGELQEVRFRFGPATGSDPANP